MSLATILCNKPIIKYKHATTTNSFNPVSPLFIKTKKEKSKNVKKKGEMEKINKKESIVKSLK